MNLDPETLFSLLDKRPPEPSALIVSASAAPTQDAGPGDTPESIVGEPFFWGSASALADLS
jgi:hypothetical protein